MKIIHQGIVPEPPVIKYFGTCIKCGTIVECEDTEITISSEKRPGGIKLCSIPCPTKGCGISIILNEGKYAPQRSAQVTNLIDVLPYMGG